MRQLIRLQQFMAFLAEAASAFSDAAFRRPRSEQIQGELASTYMERGDFRAVMLSLVRDPDQKIRRMMEADYELAVTHAEKAARLYPTRAAIQFHLGEAHRRRGSPLRQADAWRRALESHERAVLIEMKLAEGQVRRIEEFLRDQE
jgi:tetratricopeptide (TPR) repeat protein